MCNQPAGRYLGGRAGSAETLWLMSYSCRMLGLVDVCPTACCIEIASPDIMQQHMRATGKQSVG